MLSFTPSSIDREGARGNEKGIRERDPDPIPPFFLSYPFTSLSGPIREVEREVPAAQARAQKNKTSPLEVLFRRLVVTNVLFPRRNEGGRWKETVRERNAATARRERPYISYKHCLHEEPQHWERPVPPKWG